LIALTFSSCNKDKIEGMYILENSEVDEDFYSYSRTLFDFNQDSVTIIKFGDYSTGQLGEKSVERLPVEYGKNYLSIGEYKFDFRESNEGFELSPKGDFTNSLKLSPLKADKSIVEDSRALFNGSFKVTSNDFVDSLDFITDSTVLHTSHSTNAPGHSWTINNYKGIQILNIHDELFPLLVIQKTKTDTIYTRFFGGDQRVVKFTPTSTELSPQDLIGSWIEVESSLTKGPPPPPSSNGESRLNYYNHYLDIQSDSQLAHTMTVHYLGKSVNRNWNLTWDGNKIYFPENVRNIAGLWDLYEITDSTLTIGINNSSGSSEERIKLKKKKNGS
jgi:hypothetical protein